MQSTGIRQLARALRRNSSEAEKQLWRLLRRRAIGVRFRRQHPIGRFIVDFACVECKLVVELDGSQHLESAADQERDQWLCEQGYMVLRFWNNEAMHKAEDVLAQIDRSVRERMARG